MIDYMDEPPLREAKHDEPCEFCRAGVDEDCGAGCPTLATDPLAAIGIPPADQPEGDV